jgi:hypothetical protein
MGGVCAVMLDHWTTRQRAISELPAVSVPENIRLSYCSVLQ